MQKVNHSGRRPATDPQDLSVKENIVHVRTLWILRHIPTNRAGRNLNSNLQQELIGDSFLSPRLKTRSNFIFADDRSDMVLIRVEYDAYNRRFKLLDRELARLLEDGEQYLLVADLAAQDLDPKHLL